MNEYVVDQLMHSEETDLELSLRPTRLRQYIGQNSVKSNLKVFARTTKLRHKPLNHVLLFGPPGLGRIALSNIIADGMEVNIRTVSGPSLERPGDLAAILSELRPGDILFVDGIHRLSSAVGKVLYPAMEDFSLDIIIGKSDKARSIRTGLPPFALVDATMQAGSLTGPLRDRSGMHLKLEYHNESDLKEIVIGTTEVLGTGTDEESTIELAKRSRGASRVANRLLKRVRDFQQVNEDEQIYIETTKHVLGLLRVDQHGLDYIDHKMMDYIIKQRNGGPVGLDVVAVAIGEERITIEDVYEPLFIQKGFLGRTPRDRKAMPLVYEHLAKPNEEGE